MTQALSVEPERVPEHPVGEVDPGRVEHGPPELVLAAVVAVLLGGLRLRQPTGQIAPVLAPVRLVPVVVAGVPRADVPDRRERAPAGRSAHLHGVVAAVARPQGPPRGQGDEQVLLGDDVPVRRRPADEALAGGEHPVAPGLALRHGGLAGRGVGRQRQVPDDGSRARRGARAQHEACLDHVDGVGERGRQGPRRADGPRFAGVAGSHSVHCPPGRRPRTSTDAAAAGLPAARVSVASTRSTGAST